MAEPVDLSTLMDAQQTKAKGDPALKGAIRLDHPLITAANNFLSESRRHNPIAMLIIAMGQGGNLMIMAEGIGGPPQILWMMRLTEENIIASALRPQPNSPS